MRILIFHGYLLRGTGSNIYNANLARSLAGLGHEVHLFCQDRSAQGPEGVTIHVPDIGRVLPVYVADHYEGFDALPFPELDEAALALDQGLAAVISSEEITADSGKPRRTSSVRSRSRPRSSRPRKVESDQPSRSAASSRVSPWR